MPAKINWNVPVTDPNVLKFTDLSLGDTFCIATKRSSYAVYMVVSYGVDRYMLELATSKIFSATNSPIERVPVEINIGATKPAIY